MAGRSLTQIANAQGTDKGTVGPTDSWPAHNYTDLYEAYLDPIRMEPFNILEIGIGVEGDEWDAKIAKGRNQGGGGSLKMWYEYLPHATVYATDINDGRHLSNDWIKVFVGDQGKVEDWQRFAEAAKDVEFDLIIDDGSFRAPSSCRHLSSRKLAASVSW